MSSKSKNIKYIVALLLILGIIFAVKPFTIIGTAKSMEITGYDKARNVAMVTLVLDQKTSKIVFAGSNEYKENDISPEGYPLERVIKVPDNIKITYEVPDYGFRTAYAITTKDHLTYHYLKTTYPLQILHATTYPDYRIYGSPKSEFRFYLTVNGVKKEIVTSPDSSLSENINGVRITKLGWLQRGTELEADIYNHYLIDWSGKGDMVLLTPECLKRIEARNLSYFGSADLRYWSDWLASEGNYGEEYGLLNVIFGAEDPSGFFGGKHDWEGIDNIYPPCLWQFKDNLGYMSYETQNKLHGIKADVDVSNGMFYVYHKPTDVLNTIVLTIPAYYLNIKEYIRATIPEIVDVYPETLNLKYGETQYVTVEIKNKGDNEGVVTVRISGDNIYTKSVSKNIGGGSTVTFKIPVTLNSNKDTSATATITAESSSGIYKAKPVIITVNGIAVKSTPDISESYSSGESCIPFLTCGKSDSGTTTDITSGESEITPETPVLIIDKNGITLSGDNKWVGEVWAKDAYPDKFEKPSGVSGFIEKVRRLITLGDFDFTEDDYEVSGNKLAFVSVTNGNDEDIIGYETLYKFRIKGENKFRVIEFGKDKGYKLDYSYTNPLLFAPLLISILAVAGYFAFKKRKRRR